MRVKATLAEKKKIEKFDMKRSMISGLWHWNYHEKKRDVTRNIKHVSFVPIFKVQV